jgi:hypothetical protein
MSRTYDNEKKPSQSTTSFKPTASFLQTRGFAPIQTDLDEDVAPRPSGYTENFLEKIINQRGTESSDTPVQTKPINRLKKTFQDKRVAMIQAKLSIGEPNDKYEQEADATASKVVQQINSPTQDKSVQKQESMEEDELQMKPISSIQREEMEEMEEEDELQMKPISSIQREEMEEMEEEDELQMKPISSIQREEMEEMEEEDELQMKPISSIQREEEDELQMKPLVQRRENLGAEEAPTDLESSIQSARGSGQPLDPSLQSKMGQAMGADFSRVKVHIDSQSNQLNKSIQAKAFTTGQDVFFRQGAYAPSSRSGQELIAHELTHVIQQNPTVQRTVSDQVVDKNDQQLNNDESNSISDGFSKNNLVQMSSEKNKIMRKGEKELKNSIDFEKNLGVYAYHHPKANAAADEMNQKIIDALIPDFKFGVQEEHEKLVSLFTRKGKPEDIKKSAGQVSPDFNTVLSMIMSGNLREKMTALMNAMFGSFKKDVVKQMSESAWDKMQQKGLNVDKLKRRKKQMKFNPGAKDLFRDPGNPLDRKNFSSWSHTSNARTANAEKDSFSKRTVQDLDDLGVGLSDREKQFMYGDKIEKGDDIQDENLTWQEGGTYWKVNQNDKWVKNVQEKLHMPVTAGPSGTALRTFQIWEYLSKPTTAADLRLALLGWMLTSNDHSFHEIMLTSSEFGGLSYKPGLDAYHNIPPIAEDELRSNVAIDGTFPDEANYGDKVEGGEFNMVTDEQIDAVKYLVNNNSPDFVRPLTQDWEILAVLAVLIYTDENPSAYKFINNVLNGSENKAKMYYFINQDSHLSPLYKSNKFNIKSIIGESKDHAKMAEIGLTLLNPYVGNVYRGYKAWSLPKKGQSISDNKFFSTTTEEDLAQGFANKGKGRYKIVTRIQSKTGRNIGEVSMVGNEGEVLFAPGTKFKTTSDPVKTGEFYYIDWQEQ